MDRPMSDKSCVIASIASQMEQYGITLPELAAVLKPGTSDSLRSEKKDIALRLFFILGGVFVLAGVSVYMGMFWHQMNTPMRIFITLGVGLAVQLAGIVALGDERYKRAVTPLLLIAIIMQPIGWFVAVDELFGHLNDAHDVTLFITALMAIQQIAIFSRYRLTLLLLAALAFGYVAAFTWLDLLHAHQNWVVMLMGVSMLAIAHALRTTPHIGLTAIGYFIGGICFFEGAFDLLHNTPIELAFLAIACVMIYISTLLRSGTLLTVSVLSMLFYICYFTNKHFVNSMGWPLSLMALGVAFFAIGGFAFRIKKQYITS
jgi:hypothetical protein